MQARLRPTPRPLGRILRIALAVGTIGAALPALAQEARPGPYAGIAIGKPDWQAGSVGGVAGDTSGTGLKIYGGWRWHPNFGAELGAVRLGRLDGAAAGEAKADGVSLDAVGWLPLAPQWSAFGRAGLAQVKTSVPGASDRHTAPKFGAGAQYQLNGTTALRGEWERYRIDAFGAKSNVDLYSLGVQVSF